MPSGPGQYAFPPYLPDDIISLPDDSSSGSLDLLCTELYRLLSEEPKDFWQAVSHHKSLRQSLDSFLQFARRTHDSTEENTGPPPKWQELSRLIFLVFLRMVTVEEGGLHAMVQAHTLYDEWLLDVPTLMDLATLYGADNEELVQSFMKQVFGLQPMYFRDVVTTAQALGSNIHAVCETCHSATGRMSASSAGTTLSGLADGIAYLHDTSATLAAFVRSYPPAAIPLAGSGSSGLLSLLPPLHDDLLPQIAGAAAKLRGGASGPGLDGDTQATQLAATQQMQHHLRGLSDCLPSLTSLLIVHGLLGLHSPPPWQQPGSAPEPTAPQRGQQLMAALMSVELPPGPDRLEASLLHRTARQFHLADAVRQSLLQGRVALDDVQQEYLFMQLGERAYQGVVAPGKLNNGPSSSGQRQSSDRNIDGILEVLPEYGRGFLSACLAESNNDPETVIHQLLEGTLPKHLSKMDPHLTTWQPQMPAAPQPGTSQAAGPGLSWNGVLEQAAAPAPSMTAAPPTVSQPTPKPGAHKATARAMAVPAADRATIRAHADAAQWDEWDDEYDDSFDDLGAVNLDGTADVEGNDEDAWPAKGPGARADRQQGQPSTSQPKVAPQQGGRQKKAARLWVLDGRIYNYRKEGATEVAGQGEAQELVQAAQNAAEHIHGLGAGGNKPTPQPEVSDDQLQQHLQQHRQPKGESAGALRSTGSGRTHQQGHEGNNAAGGNRRSHAHKDKNKAAVANHHRKDRAMRKFAGPPA